jgi:hypothetical protein
MSAKGYVVRGKDRQGRDCWASGDVAGFARASRRESATAYADLDSAIEGWTFMHGTCHDVVILAVAEDGTETPLPSYEEALVRLDAVCAAAEDVCGGFTEEGETKGPLSLRINRLMAALAARKART